MFRKGLSATILFRRIVFDLDVELLVATRFGYGLIGL
jgi:hypothetical protein